MDRLKRAVIIPAYNEITTIKSVVTGALPYAQVIVVDDGSTDSTADIARAAGAYVVTNKTNQGYDHSLRHGFKVAESLKCNAIVTMDADGEHDPDFLLQFFELIESGTPLVLGRRLHTNRMAEAVIGFYVKWRYKAHDILCGMKGYHIDLINKVGEFGDMNSIGTELAIKSLARGYPFCEVAISGKQRLDSSRFGTGIKANWTIFITLLKVLMSQK